MGCYILKPLVDSKLLRQRIERNCRRLIEMELNDGYFKCRNLCSPFHKITIGRGRQLDLVYD